MFRSVTVDGEKCEESVALKQESSTLAAKDGEIVHQQQESHAQEETRATVTAVAEECQEKIEEEIREIDEKAEGKGFKRKRKSNAAKINAQLG